MQVCFFGDSLSMLSGTSKPLYILADELQKCSVDITVLSGEMTDRQKEINHILLNENEIENVNIIYLENLIKKITGKKDQQLIEIIKDSDIIQGFDLFSLYHLRNMINSHKIAKPLVYSLTGSYKLEMHDFYSAGLPSLLNLQKKSFLFKFFCPKGVIHNLFKKFDKIITTSEFMYRTLDKNHFPMQQVKHFNIGINPENYQKFKIHNKDPVYDFLFFGWGSSIRGVPDLLKAFEIVLRYKPDAKLGIFFLGSHGSEENYYSASIRNRKYFKKSVDLNIGPNMDMIKVIQTSRSVVLPFRSAFGYSHPPLTVMESMFLGTPVISTNVGSIPELLTDGTTGLVVPPHNSEALSQKMLLIYDENITNPIIDKGFEKIVTDYNIHTNAKLMKLFYNEILEGSIDN
jgi:glycosyltransferase involved in cell wall biosynthesis